MGACGSALRWVRVGDSCCGSFCVSGSPTDEGTSGRDSFSGLLQRASMPKPICVVRGVPDPKGGLDDARTEDEGSAEGNAPRIGG